jgi:hypothetical protein
MSAQWRRSLTTRRLRQPHAAQFDFQPVLNSEQNLKPVVSLHEG